MKTALCLAGLLGAAQAFVAPQFSAPAAARVRTNAIKMENFNLPLGEDQAENVPTAMLGEANYRKFVASYKPDGLIVGGARYPLLKRVSELKLLSLTAETGLLTRLEEMGLKLSDLEKLLPLAEELELLPLAEKNKDLILETLAPLAIEQAPALLPVLVGVLKTPPTVFYGVAAAALAAEAGVVALSGNPIIDVLAGIPLVAVAGASAVAGSVLSSGLPIPSGGASSSRAAAPRAAAPTAQAAAPAAAAVKKGGRPSATKVKVAVKAAAPAAKPAAAKPALKLSLKPAAKAAPAPAAAPKPKAAAPSGPLKAAAPAAKKGSLGKIPKALKK